MERNRKFCYWIKYIRDVELSTSHVFLLKGLILIIYYINEEIIILKEGVLIMQISGSTTVAYMRLNGTLTINSTDAFNRMDTAEAMKISFSGTPSTFPNKQELEKIKGLLLCMRERYNDGIMDKSYIIEFKDIGVCIDMVPFPGYLRPGFNVLTEWIQFIKK